MTSALAARRPRQPGDPELATIPPRPSQTSHLGSGTVRSSPSRLVPLELTELGT